MREVDERLYRAVERSDALYVACRLSDLPTVIMLLTRGENPNAAYDTSHTVGFEVEPCLYAAVSAATTHSGGASDVAAWATIEVVRLLLANGADPNAPRVDRDDVTSEFNALHASRSRPDLRALLEQYGARE